MIVLITGLKRSGKDTMADYLVKNYGFTKYAFADPIRDVCKIIFDWNENHFNDKLMKERVDPDWGVSPRYAMQWIGTEGFQYYLPDDCPLFKKMTGRKVWARKFVKWYERAGKGNRVVVPDWRFPHEQEEARRVLDDVYFVRVNNPNITPNDSHESEIHIPKLPVDFSIKNEGSFEDFFNCIEENFIDKIF